MSERPRRSTRAPAKVPVVHASSLKRNADDNINGTVSPRKKTKIEERDLLDILLHEPASALTTMDIAGILNANAWMELSPESRDRLCHLLPPTAFEGFEPTLDPSHPSQLDKAGSDAMDVDVNAFRCAATLNLDAFQDSHFLAAAHTYQDHIFSGWRSAAQADLRARFEQGVRDGTLHAPWKDEVWEGQHPPEVAESSLLAGEAAELKLADLVKGSMLKVGDMLAYKRNFTNLGRIVEKDVLIQDINLRTSAITVLVQPGSEPLPRALQERNPPDPTPSTRSMTISSPSQLETGVLDLEGHVSRADRPNGNAWKNFSVWRWADGVWDNEFSLLRGGRDTAMSGRIRTGSARVTLANLTPAHKSQHSQKRVGRGQGSGYGGTAGRGANGQNSRTGSKVKPGFTGGQTPLSKRFPKRGFTNQNDKTWAPVNLDRLQHWINQGRLDSSPSKPITARELLLSGCIHDVHDGIKLLGDGAEHLKTPIHITPARASQSAIKAIEGLGGSVYCKYYNTLSLRDCVKGRTDRRAAAPTRREDILWYTSWRNRGYLSKESILRMPVVEDRWRQLSEELPKWKEQGFDVKKKR
ncbi:hypothetical protein HWV62_24067 [Athelia sp. TMB]|nr:hypothetical protein HWV62_24067 [Athelia sp. TMB]